MQFNLSHTRGLAACAIARDVSIGIDVECLERNTDWGSIAGRYFSRFETRALAALPVGERPERFFEDWTLKEAYVKAQNLSATALTVTFNGATGTATVFGVAADQPTKEKILLCCGNVGGVSKVDDKMTVEVAEPQATFYTVVSGDNLSKIAKQHYGDANKYPVIFEANKPMLKHPDKIYPGQVLRIPPK